jgi:hypothetical protein
VLHGPEHDVQHLILGTVDIWRVGPVGAGEENVPDGVPALCFRQPTSLAAVKLDELACVEALADFVMGCPNRAGVPACPLLNMRFALSRLALAKGLAAFGAVEGQVASL